mmetsp:Transcript_65871/g.183715  ORF Transcript_65871/g.183715 Transcript_65871/m.183715 type:complete len:232 (+) Transcript_65871:79-774(+)
MPRLPLSPTASQDEPQSACAPSALWPPTPTPKAEAYALHIDGICRPLLLIAPHNGSAPDQGTAPVLFEIEGQHTGVLAGKSSLLGGQRSQPVRVKNTFIDVLSDDEEHSDGPGVAACKSWCVGATRQGYASWPCGSTSEGAPWLGLSAEPPSPPPSPPSPARKPQASAGADLHGTGRCRPCGWFWKPEGCVQGAECCHCHMCPRGELKERKKAKFARMRARKQAERANGSQ